MSVSAGGVLHPVELQIRTEPVRGQMFWRGGRQVLRRTFRAKDLRAVRGGRQGQIQIPDDHVHEGTHGKTRPAIPSGLTDDAQLKRINFDDAQLIRINFDDSPRANYSSKAFRSLNTRMLRICTLLCVPYCFAFRAGAWALFGTFACTEIYYYYISIRSID